MNHLAQAHGLQPVGLLSKISSYESIAKEPLTILQSLFFVHNRLLLWVGDLF